MNVLEGQLKGYEGVSEEALKEKEEEIKEINLSIKSKEELLIKIKKNLRKRKKFGILKKSFMIRGLKKRV